MKRIESLHLKNFKAFRDQIFEFGGKNVLIYGNNGSGKSSLFWALYTFLQSSGKTNSEIQKYFRQFESGNPATFESLKNVFAEAAEDAFVKMNWTDEDAQLSGENIISAAVMNTNWGANNPISIANLGSDFINYKLLHNFFQATHKDEINLWEVFLRDIFPFFQPQGRSEDFLRLIQNSAMVPHTGRKVVSGKVKERFIAELEFLNNSIETFLEGIVTQANLLLSGAFSEGQKRLEIELEYSKLPNERLNFEDIRWGRSKPKIRLTLQFWNEQAARWIPIRRPQSFLNEALLTRVALAVRIGALNSRLEQSDFKVLCLDDMLISLDMSNRMQVLKWLLNPTEKPYNSFQIILLTHDRAFYEITKHQIESHELKGDWKFWEMYNDEFHDLKQPHLAAGNSHLELAEKYFWSFDFPACANHLRKECEKRIKFFLPEHLWYQEHKASGDIRQKLLGDLIDELKKYHDINNKDFLPFANLKLYKDLLMNPLSHDSYGTAVFQAELREIMDDLIPKLDQLKNEIVFEVERGKEKILNMKIIDEQGGEWNYRIQLFEHFRKVTFLDGIPVFSKTECRVLDRSNAASTIESFPSNKYDSLQDAYKRACKRCKAVEPYPDLLTIIS